MIVIACQTRHSGPGNDIARGPDLANPENDLAGLIQSACCRFTSRKLLLLVQFSLQSSTITSSSQHLCVFFSSPCDRESMARAPRPPVRAQLRHAVHGVCSCSSSAQVFTSETGDIEFVSLCIRCMREDRSATFFCLCAAGACMLHQASNNPHAELWIDRRPNEAMTSGCLRLHRLRGLSWKWFTFFWVALGCDRALVPRCPVRLERELVLRSTWCHAFWKSGWDSSRCDVLDAECDRYLDSFVANETKNLICFV